jgi:IS5 family transposase
MKQSALDLKLNVKKTRKREFLAQMECMVPWSALVALIAPYYPEGCTGLAWCLAWPSSFGAPTS